ncbi:hypothetical protein RIF29_20098 [Crotalaria pallida]|uniref:CRIB domain-containing protein n=1 Tax=Crotalaria pallida TaxID=3830 RepID=A0AAN9F2B7_CROPI
MSSSKVKGLLRGLRYISQIFDNEKEQEIQIGNPTDVKHVAHIGWDGPSVNSPSWMNEFKTSPGFASAPLSQIGDVPTIVQDNSVQWVSEDSRRGSRHGKGRALPELPKGSRRQSTSNITDSPTKEKSDKSRQRKSNKPKEIIQLDSLAGDGSPARSLPDIPKTSRRKKSKDNSNNGGGSTSRLRTKDQSSDSGSPSGSVSRSRNKQRSLEDDEQYERGVTTGLS